MVCTTVLGQSVLLLVLSEVARQAVTTVLVCFGWYPQVDGDRMMQPHAHLCARCAELYEALYSECKLTQCVQYQQVMSPPGLARHVGRARTVKVLIVLRNCVSRTHGSTGT